MYIKICYVSIIYLNFDILMDYSCYKYKHKISIYTTRDGFKYTQVKSIHEVIYSRYVLRQNSNRCRGTAKLNKISNLIESKHAHNHTISLMIQTCTN